MPCRSFTFVQRRLLQRFRNSFSRDLRVKSTNGLFMSAHKKLALQFD